MTFEKNVDFHANGIYELELQKSSAMDNFIA